MVDFICHLIIYGFIWFLAYLFCLGVVANYQTRIAHLIDPERYRKVMRSITHSMPRCCQERCSSVW